MPEPSCAMRSSCAAAPRRPYREWLRRAPCISLVQEQAVFDELAASSRPGALNRTPGPLSVRDMLPAIFRGTELLTHAFLARPLHTQPLRAGCLWMGSRVRGPEVPGCGFRAAFLRLRWLTSPPAQKSGGVSHRATIPSTPTGIDTAVLRKRRGPGNAQAVRTS